MAQGLYRLWAFKELSIIRSLARLFRRQQRCRGLHEGRESLETELIRIWRFRRDCWTQNSRGLDAPLLGSRCDLSRFGDRVSYLRSRVDGSPAARRKHFQRSGHSLAGLDARCQAQGDLSNGLVRCSKVQRSAAKQ